MAIWQIQSVLIFPFLFDLRGNEKETWTHIVTGLLVNEERWMR